MRIRAGMHGIRFSQALPLLLGSLAVLLLAKAPRKLVEATEPARSEPCRADAPVASGEESPQDAPEGASSGESPKEERQAILALRESVSPRAGAETARPAPSGHGHAAHPDRAAPRADRLFLGVFSPPGSAVSGGRAPPPFAPRAPPVSV